MGKKLFTAEEIEILRSNPYTYSVTSHTLFLTKEFKELFWEEYQSGRVSARQILEKHGYPAELLGQRRIWGITQSIKEQHLSLEGIHEGYLPRKARNKAKGDVQSTEDRVDYLENKILYMEQQIEFLKKIASIRNMRK